MKIHVILGILWMAFCSYTALTQMWPLFHISLFPPDEAWLGILICLLIVILYWTGAVSGYFLLRGVRWARRFIILIAIFTLIYSIVAIDICRSHYISCGFIIIFSLVSTLLLFLPYHQPIPKEISGANDHSTKASELKTE